MIKIDFEAHKRKFREKSTASLTQGYSRFNEDFRRIARDEFKKRKVPSSQLPYKKKEVKKKDPFDMSLSW